MFSYRKLKSLEMDIPKDFEELYKTKIVPHSSGDLGNLIPVPVVKKQVPPSVRWCWVYNNYKEDEISSIVLQLSEVSNMYCFCEEVGVKGTPHLQGYTEFKKKIRPHNYVKVSGTIWWIKCKGDRESNINYCSKTGGVLHSKGLPTPLKLIDPIKDWQVDILKIVESEPNDRSIYWFWSEGGGIGKTSFCKYLFKIYGYICLQGRGKDMRNGIVEYGLANNGATPMGITINIPRNFDPNYISYEGLENLKDMFFYSGKYKGGMVCGNSPQVLVFANTRPVCDDEFMKRIIVKKL